MANDSDLDKSEQPTDSKIKKAKEKGQIPRSRELTSLFILLIGISLLLVIGPYTINQLITIIKMAIKVSHSPKDDALSTLYLVNLVTAGIWSIVPVFIGLVITAIFAPLAIGGLLFSLQSIKPNFSKLDRKSVV